MLTSAPEVSAAALRDRAYVISQQSDELTVFDLRQMKIVGRVATGGINNHMAELSADLGKVYINSSETHETVVVDARTLRVVKRISIGGHPSHLAMSPHGSLLAIMDEDDNAVVFVDTDRDEVVKRLPGFFVPHFIRFAADGKFAYVANIGANHVTRVDMQRLEIDGHVALDGFEGPPNATVVVNEGGFADVQIDRSGVLYAAHASSGRVLVYDTKTLTKLPEVAVGRGPWVVFAEHPFDNVPLRHLVPNFADRTISLIDGSARGVMATLPGDEEA
jgi:YVTN family beta-propeller protein